MSCRSLLRAYALILTEGLAELKQRPGRGCLWSCRSTRASSRAVPRNLAGPARVATRPASKNTSAKRRSSSAACACSYRRRNAVEVRMPWRARCNAFQLARRASLHGFDLLDQSGPDGASVSPIPSGASPPTRSTTAASSTSTTWPPLSMEEARRSSRRRIAWCSGCCASGRSPGSGSITSTGSTIPATTCAVCRRRARELVAGGGDQPIFLVVEKILGAGRTAAGATGRLMARRGTSSQTRSTACSCRPAKRAGVRRDLRALHR